MERSQVIRALSLPVVVGGLLLGCVNPFAPALRGSTESLWTDASTVGELLANFATAYSLQDSLRYADLLDESFQFQYFDPNLHRVDGWDRETDLRITARLFRSFQSTSVIWGGVSPVVSEIATADSLVDIPVRYHLVLEDVSSLMGFARFTLYKPAGDRFRILLWQDEF